MLIRVYEVVVRSVVQKDKAEANGEASKRRACPTEGWVRRPCEDEQANRDEPTTDHHRDKTDLRRRASTVLPVKVEVVFVDQRGTNSRRNDPNSEGDEH